MVGDGYKRQKADAAAGADATNAVDAIADIITRPASANADGNAYLHRLRATVTDTGDCFCRGPRAVCRRLRPVDQLFKFNRLCSKTLDIELRRDINFCQLSPKSSFFRI